MANLNTLDPAWAWSTFEPTREQPWSRRLAAHLYRRAGFGVTSAQLDDAVKQSPAEAVKQLLAADEPESFQTEIDDLAEAVLAGGDPNKLSAWWLYRLLDTPNQLLEKTTLFWHGHFATSAEKVTEAELMYEQNNMLRRHALGDFAAMVQEISRDPAMLIYLDSVTNRKAHPNENYAREVMELFCLGEGNYTEQDVQEVARCFTGWEIRRDKFRFNRFQHDNGRKSILGKTGEFGGEDAVRIILEQPDASRFIVTKMIRYFLFDEPAAPESLIEPLAKQYRDDGYDTARLIERILGSRLFFSQHCVGRKVRSPIEFVAALLRGLESKADVFRLQRELAGLGQTLFFPPNVKGWDGGRAWVNSSTLLGRANLVRGLVDDRKSRFGDDGLEELAAKHGKESPAAIVDWLVEILFAVPLPGAVRGSLIEIASRRGSRSRNIGEVIHAMSTLPEFQLG